MSLILSNFNKQVTPEFQLSRLWLFKLKQWFHVGSRATADKAQLSLSALCCCQSVWCQRCPLAIDCPPALMALGAPNVFFSSPFSFYHTSIISSYAPPPFRYVNIIRFPRLFYFVFERTLVAILLIFVAIVRIGRVSTSMCTTPIEGQSVSIVIKTLFHMCSVQSSPYIQLFAFVQQKFCF